MVYDASGNQVATGVFRNYYTNHDPYFEAYWTHEDYSWFYLPEEDGHYLLGSTADLYGFSRIVNEWGYFFSGETVALARDLVINDGTAVKGTASTEPYWEANGNKVTAWNQIGGSWGSYENTFAGTFDGGGNSLSGLYITESADGVGFFRSLPASASIKDFAIVNSYIAGASSYVGSFVGFSYSTKLENLYADTIIHNGRDTTLNMGGIVGHMDAPHANHFAEVEECWFNGQLYVSGWGNTFGGIVGMLYNDYQAHFTFTDCLFSGEIIQTVAEGYPNMGGIMGQMSRSDGNSTHYSTVKIYNCVNSGKMSTAGTVIGASAGGIGAYLPWLSWTDNILTTSEIKNCHAVTSDCYAYEISNGGGIKYDEGYSEDISVLKATTQAEVESLLPRLPEQLESVWTADTQNNGPVILKNFSHLYYK